MLKKFTLGGIGLLFLASPALAFAAVSIPCRNNDVGCTTTQLVQAANSTDLGLTTAQRIELMRDAIKQLTYEINQLQFRDTSNSAPTCLELSYDLYIGKTDNSTNGEVTKLQQFLTSVGLLNTQVTGYYGPLTAQAVVQWQKAHGMDFVTTRSGVGPMTRAKMKCGSTGAPVITKVEWRIEPANPSATDSYKKDEQAIFVDVIRSDNSIRGYSVGKAYGCAASNDLPSLTGKKVLGFVNCYYALSGVAFTAYEENGRFVVERHSDDASGRTSGITAVVLEI
ncbi:MAG TPA: peptidoglycan-binding domain-containing protein [Candidatus Paceibacterota bacterium]